MTVEELRGRILKHNAVQVFVGLLAMAGAPLLWWFSFCVIRVIFTMATSWFLGGNTATVTFWIAVGGVVLLVAVGMRDGLELFTLDSFEGAKPIGWSGPAPMIYVRRVQTYSFVISHVLLCAPQVTLAGVRAFRTLLRPGPFTIDRAVQVHDDLAARREWVALDEYPGVAGAAALLRELGLVWLEDDDGEGPVRLRIPPANRAEETSMPYGARD